MRKRSKALGLIAALAAGASLTACDTRVPANVCLWGDSIMAQIPSQLIHDGEFRDYGYTFSAMGVVGGLGVHDWDMYWSTRIPNAMANVNCGIHVVNLGTNDNAAGYASHVDDFINALGTDTKQIWITPVANGNNPEERAAVTQDAKAEALLHPNVTVVSADTLVSPTGLADSKGHLNDEGIVEYADKLEDVLDTFYPPPEGEVTEVG